MTSGHRLQSACCTCQDSSCYTEAVDAFSQDWSGDNNFLHPPYGLIPRVLAKLLATPRVSATLIVPDWPSKPWYRPLLLLADKIRMVPAGTYLFSRTSSGRGRRPTVRTRWKVLVLRVEKGEG